MLRCQSARQSDIRGEAAEARSQHLDAVLVDQSGAGEDQSFLLVLLLDGDGAGDSIADGDSLGVFKVHLRRQEAEQTADMRNHAAGEQAGNNALPEPRALRKRLIDVIRVVIARHTTEKSNIPFRKCALKRKRLPYLHGLKRLAQLLLKLRCRTHTIVSFLSSSKAEIAYFLCIVRDRWVLLPGQTIYSAAAALPSHFVYGYG